MGRGSLEMTGATEKNMNISEDLDEMGDQFVEQADVSMKPVLNCNPLIEGCETSETIMSSETTSANDLKSSNIDTVVPESNDTRPAPMEMASGSLICYDIQCNGKGCITETIIQSGESVTTCTTTLNQVCVIKESESTAGSSLVAGCGPPCDFKTTNTQPTTCNPSLDCSQTDVSPRTTTFDWFSIPKRRKRAITDDDVNRRECCNVQMGTTIKRSHFRLKRALSANDVIRKECCNQRYCNHDNPCGNLTCAAGIPRFTNVFVLLIIGVIVLVKHV